MDLTPYLETLRADLAAAAAPGGSDTARAAELLSHSLDASARLALLEALSDAAAEITTRLPDSSVEVRLRGREADLVVTTTAVAETEPAHVPPAAVEGDLTRLTLRMPEALKTQVELTAAAEGISVNAWLVRAVTLAVQRPAGPPPNRPGKRITGFAQA
ncbi:toxin-antitoxin system HicB family antitoxin [Actinoplanes sp. NPDC051470]|uniref:toxin-antitoxin system HicB family antitoxin n=1 Tax=Actinoplanes sp. NPDC051470 TaxID=3157224 RepID=UPI0034169C78